MFVQWAKHAACVGWWSTHGVSGRPHARKELDEFITRTEMARANMIFSSAASAKAGRKFYAPVSFCFGNEFMKCILIWIVSGIENRWDIHKHERTKEQKLLELLGALLGHLKERHAWHRSVALYRERHFGTCSNVVDHDCRIQNFVSITHHKAWRLVALFYLLKGYRNWTARSVTCLDDACEYRNQVKSSVCFQHPPQGVAPCSALQFYHFEGMLNEITWTPYTHYQRENGYTNLYMKMYENVDCLENFRWGTTDAKVREILQGIILLNVPCIVAVFRHIVRVVG